MNHLALKGRHLGLRLPLLPEAACQGTPPDLWHADDDDPLTRAALALCGRCPARVDCGTHALEQPEAGVWGGMTERQRDRMRRRIRAVT